MPRSTRSNALELRCRGLGGRSWPLVWRVGGFAVGRSFGGSGESLLAAPERDGPLLSLDERSHWMAMCLIACQEK
jgi:hypothetical protein